MRLVKEKRAPHSIAHMNRESVEATEMGSARITSGSLRLSRGGDTHLTAYSRASAEAAATMLRWVMVMGSLLLL